MKTDEIVNNLIHTIESNPDLTWDCIYSRGAQFRNGVTGHIYQGSNIFTLSLCSLARGYQSNLFATFLQCKEHNLVVKAGSKALYVSYFGKFAKKGINGEVETTEEGKEKFIGFRNWSPVFNFDCIEDSAEKALLVEKYKVQTFGTSALESNETFFAEVAKRENVQVITRKESIPHYAPHLDEIVMPPIEFFKADYFYYSTLAHEWIHATGHKSRLNRLKHDNSDRKAYANEELIAEVGAAILRHHLGINIPEAEKESAAYLKSWLTSLRANPKHLLTSLAAASKGADYVIYGAKVEATIAEAA